MSGKGRSSHVHPPVNDPSFRHQCVWNGITIQRLSVRIVCRVREISGRYKFGDEFALSIDGAGVHAHAPGSPLRRPSACAFTRKLGGAGPFAAELQAVHQPPPPAAACDDECPMPTAGCSREWTQPPCLSHATQVRTSSPALHGQRSISKARHPSGCRPTWAAYVSACLARRQSGWMVGFEMCEPHAGGPAGLSSAVLSGCAERPKASEGESSLVTRSSYML
jgi:hypothetical protein